MSVLFDNVEALIQKAVEKVNKSKSKLLMLSGVNPSQYTRCVSENRPFSDSILKAMADSEYFNVSYETLAAWKAVDEYSQAILLKACEDNGLSESKAFEKIEGFYRFPCRGTVTAGCLELIEEVDEPAYYEWADIKEYSSEMFCLQVRGDSMSPLIPDGAIILVRPSSVYRPNGIYVIQTSNHESTLKLLKLSPDGGQLIPVNKKYSPIAVDGFDIVRAFEVLEYKVSFQ